MKHWRRILLTGLMLLVFASVGTGLVAVTYEGTKTRIERNERDAILRYLHQIIDPERHNNDLLKDSIEVVNPAWLGSDEPQPIYLARQDDIPVALIITAIAPDGYNGKIKLLVGINMAGIIEGVRVVSHHETPGLGDNIDLQRSDWILGFHGRSLKNPVVRKWAVKKDGGVFDQFTGATITPRAVVKAVKRALLYFQDHHDELVAEIMQQRKQQHE